MVPDQLEYNAYIPISGLDAGQNRGPSATIGDEQRALSYAIFPIENKMLRDVPYVSLFKFLLLN